MIHNSMPTPFDKEVSSYVSKQISLYIAQFNDNKHIYICGIWQIPGSDIYAYKGENGINLLFRHLNGSIEEYPFKDATTIAMAPDLLIIGNSHLHLPGIVEIASNKTFEDQMEEFWQ